MVNNPLVSLIIRTKDRIHLLKKALYSVSRQTYRPIEVVLINDGGCDLPEEKIRHMLQDIPLQYVKLDQNRGRAAAGNIGLDNSKGQYIGFLDDDDSLLSDHVATLIDYLIQNRNLIAYSDCEMVEYEYDKEKGFIEKDTYIPYSEDFSYEMLLLANYIPLNCLLFHSSLKSIMHFDETFDLYEDWDMLICLAEFHPFFHIKRVTARCNLNLEKQIVTEGRLHHDAFRKIAEKHMSRITPDVLFRNWQFIVRSREISRKLRKLRLDVQSMEYMIKEKQTTIREREQTIEKQKKTIRQQERKNYEKQVIIEQREGEITKRHEEILGLKMDIGKIQNSLGWHLLESARKGIEHILPVHTKRRYYHDLIMKSIKVLHTHGPKALYYKGKRKLITKKYTHRRTKSEVILRQQKRIDKVDIIIPVFNAYRDLVECLKSVLKTINPERHRLIIVDDNSSDERVSDYLGQLGGQVIRLSNERNIGFAGTVNRGMHYSGRDVIILNSDTIVTHGWVEKMARALYSQPNIATVTPFSNNATICSVPKFCENNPVPKGFTIESFGHFIEHISTRCYPEIPTGVGFCMFIKRAVIKEIGFFDEQNFRGGYGEENDFCWKAKKIGYKHILDDSTYIYHKGGASFTHGVKIARELEAMNIMEKLHPDYIAQVQNFIQKNPLKSTHDYLFFRMNLESKKCECTVPVSVKK